MRKIDKNHYIKVHFIGIGGIGMSGIAEVLLDFGYSVSGSDLSESANVEKLRSKGAEIYIGHKRENVKDCTTIVYSSAVNEKNPEIIEAREKRIPIMRRAEMLAELMRLKHGIAIAGTHGKTTTTSFLATILQESEYDPTYIIGGIVDNLQGHAKVGKGRYLVAEADESDGSFLMLNPVMSVVTNLDYDHMDFYKTEEKYRDSFISFINKIPFYGICAINAEDDILCSLVSEFKKPWSTFATDRINKKVDYQAREIKFEDFATHYKLYYKEKFVADIQLSLPGYHNVLNSLGAISLAHSMGISFELIANSITKFKGVNRRFQCLYKNESFELLDDYGHHPTEVIETLKTLKNIRPNKARIAIFQPHRYTRTQECWDDFVNSFQDVERVYLLPIYAASEDEILNISSEKLAQDINKKFENKAISISNISELGTIISEFDGSNTSLITLGAGSIGREVRNWVSLNE